MMTCKTFITIQISKTKLANQGRASLVTEAMVINPSLLFYKNSYRLAGLLDRPLCLTTFVKAFA